MLMIPAFDSGGTLPIGRFSCDLTEAKAALVDDREFEESSSRETLWALFENAINKIGNIRCKIPSVFLSGSFVTNRVDPKDIDVAFVIDFSKIQSDKTVGSLNQIFKVFHEDGYVDGYYIPWHPIGNSTLDPISSAYFRERGKWDDFWQRNVAKVDRDPFQRHHAFPKRGYLEVIIDGYL